MWKKIGVAPIAEMVTYLGALHDELPLSLGHAAAAVLA